MPGPIQTIPQGLLGMLQLKELGQNPAVLDPTVAPNLDLTQFYLERLMQSETGLFGGVPTTAGLSTASHGQIQFTIGGIQAAVPQNETWFCTNITAYINPASPSGGNTIAAADFIRAALFVAPGGGGTVGFTVTPATADAVTARARTWQPEPMVRAQWLGPGTTFWIQVFDILVGAGTYVLNLGVRAARVPI